MYDDIKRITVKVGTSTLTYENGKPNLSRMEKLVRTLSDIKNSGKEVILVTSGAIGVGTTFLRMDKRPDEIAKKQAAAAVGQLELMFTYTKLFSEYGIIIGQVLLTKDVIDDADRKMNVSNTITELISLGTIPIINENDAVSVEEIVFGDNDTLSATVAVITESDLLIMLTDIDGLYTKNPREHSDAVLIPVVEEITDDITESAGGVGSTRGTGGMVTKIAAARIATKHGIDVVIANGKNPGIVSNIAAGTPCGTLFRGKR